MKTWLILSINVLILLIVGLGYLRYIPTGQALRTAQPLTVKAEGMRSPVIVELFTSEGCSSCPPADEVLSRLEQVQPVAGAEVIALGEHVDYWNYIGWADPFSSPTFSQRQNDYTDVFGGTGAFTPQMVVDGQAELIGSKKDLALEAISRAARRPKAKVQLSVASPRNARASSVQARITDLPPITPGETVEVVLAVTESDIQSEVSRGENAGRRLRHGTVVRRLKVVEQIKDARSEPLDVQSDVTLDPGWRRDHLRIVVFLQEHQSRKIIGAAALKLGQSQEADS